MKLSKEFIAMFREEAHRARWEINSWNGKGIDDLVVDYLERKELKPEDFTGAVILTVDEAKDVLHSLNCAWSRCPVKAECKDLVKKKIKQAEGK